MCSYSNAVTVASVALVIPVAALLPERRAVALLTEHQEARRRW